MASVFEKFFFDQRRSLLSEDNYIDMNVLGGEFDNDGYEHSHITETETQLMADCRFKENAHSGGKQTLLCLDVAEEVETCIISGQLKKHVECTKRRTNDVLKDVFGCELKLVEDFDPGAQEDTSSVSSSNGRWERGTATNCISTGTQGGSSADCSVINNSPNKFNVIIRPVNPEKSRKNRTHYNEEETPANEWALRNQKQLTNTEKGRTTEHQSDITKAKEFVLNTYHYGPFYENEFHFPEGSLIGYCLNGLIWKFGLDITLGSELTVFVRSGSSAEDKSLGKQKYEQFRDCIRTFHRMEKERVEVQQSRKKGGAVPGSAWRGGEVATASQFAGGANATNEEHQFKFGDESCKHELYNEILTKYNIPERFHVPELRHIILDVSNIAETHGSQEPKKFSWLGVKIAYDHFLSCGHKHITLIVPHFKRHKTTDAEDLKIIRLFEDHGVIKYTQSRVPQASVHDDRMMLELAEKVGGVIVSNDKFSDVARDKPEWKRIARDFVCTFIFVKDVFIVAPDPQGKQGDRLPRVLRKFDPNEYCCGTAALFCKFGELCNYGKKCRYMHRTVKENKRIRSKRTPTGCSGSSASIASQVSQSQAHLHYQSMEGSNLLHQQYGRENQNNPTIRVINDNSGYGVDQSAMQQTGPRHQSSLHPSIGGQGSFFAVANSPIPRHFASQHSVSSNESGDAFVLTSNQRTGSLNSSFSNLSYGGSQHSDDSMSFQSNTTSSSFAMHPTIYERGDGGDYSEINSSASSVDLYSQQFARHAYYHHEMDPSSLSDTSSLTSSTSSYLGHPVVNNPNDVRRVTNNEMYGYYHQPEVTQRRHTIPIVERQNSSGPRMFDDYANEFETIGSERRETVNVGSVSGVNASNIGVAGHSRFGTGGIENTAVKNMSQMIPNMHMVMKEPQQRSPVSRPLHVPEDVGGQEIVGSTFSHVSRENEMTGNNQKCNLNRNAAIMDSVGISEKYSENENQINQHPLNVQKTEYLAPTLDAESKKEVAPQMNTEDEKLRQQTVDQAASNISLVASIYPLEFCLLANQDNPNLAVENKQLFCAKVAQLFCENNTAENSPAKTEKDHMFKTNAPHSKSSQILSKLNETNTMIYHLTKLLPQASMESIISSFPEIVSSHQKLQASAFSDSTTMPSNSANPTKMTTSQNCDAAKIARDHLRRLLFK